MGLDVDGLFNVLVSTFVVMFMGFILPRLGLIDQNTAGKGIGGDKHTVGLSVEALQGCALIPRCSPTSGLVANVLLPAVLFKQMATLSVGLPYTA